MRRKDDKLYHPFSVYINDVLYDWWIAETARCDRGI